MKITVNKEAQKQRFKKEVDNALSLIVQGAERGLSKVTYRKIRGEHYNSFDLIDAVVKETEGSVRGRINQQTFEVEFIIKY